MAMISRHFSIEEVLRSSQPYTNEVSQVLRYGHIVTPEAIRQNVARLGSTILDQLSDQFGGWGISSWYRSPRVNAAVGGASNSAHLVGLAADGHPLHGSFAEAIEWIGESMLPFDRVIYEVRGSTKWLHVQAAEQGAAPARVFYASPKGGIYTIATSAALAAVASQ